MKKNRNNETFELKFSDLDYDEKKKYLDFMVSNNIAFQQSNNKDFIATIKIKKKNENEKPKPKEINSNGFDSKFGSAFQLARLNSKKEIDLKEIKNFENIEDKNKIKNERKSKSVNEKRNANEIKRNNVPKKLPNFEKFKKFYSKFSFLDTDAHPKTFTKDWALKIIEEIYSNKFNKDTFTIKSNTGILAKEPNHLYLENNDFPSFVYFFFESKYKIKKLLEQNAYNFIATIEHFSQDPDIILFINFLIEDYNYDDLIFFLFARSLLEKECNLNIYSKLKKEIINLNNFYLSLKQCIQIITMIFGNREKEIILKFSTLIKDFLLKKSTSNEIIQKISAYKFLFVIVQEYNIYKFQIKKEQILFQKNEDLKIIEKIDETQIMNKQIKSLGSKKELIDLDEPYESIEKPVVSFKSEDTNKNFFIEVESKVYEIVEEKLKEFISSVMNENSYNLNEEQIINLNQKAIKIVGKKTKNLIKALFVFDKLKWFSLLMIQDANQEQLDFVENLQKNLRILQKKQIKDIKLSDLEAFAKLLLKTPELANEITKLIVQLTLSK